MGKIYSEILSISGIESACMGRRNLCDNKAFVYKKEALIEVLKNIHIKVFFKKHPKRGSNPQPLG